MSAGTEAYAPPVSSMHHPEQSIQSSCSSQQQPLLPSAAPGSYGDLLFKFWCFLAYLCLVAMLLLALWAVVNIALLSAWTAQTRNLDEVGRRAGMCELGGGQLLGAGGQRSQHVQMQKGVKPNQPSWHEAME